MNKKRIAWVIIPLSLGGGNFERFRLWAKYLNRRKFELDIVYYTPSTKKNEIAKTLGSFRRVNMRGIQAPNKILACFFAFLILSRDFVSDKYSLIHSLKSLSDLPVGFAKLFTGKSIPTLSMTAGTKVRTSPFKVAVYEHIFRLIKTTFDSFQVVCGEDRDELIYEYKVDPDKIEKYKIGIDFEDYAVDNSKKESAMTFGWLGRMTKVKGLEDFLQGIRAFLDKHENSRETRFLIGGDGPLKSKSQSYIKKWGLTDSVEFIGWVKNISGFINSINVLVLSSLDEGTPRVILESFYHGVPVIATDVGGVSEIIEDTKTGLLVSPRSPDSIAKQISYIVENPETVNLMGDNARRYVENNHNIRSTIHQLERLYEQFL